MEVTLVSMPFSFFNRPALGISLLRGALLRDGIDCDIQYLQLSFAKMIGPDLYRQIAQCAPRTLLGEWLFAQALFGDLLPEPQKYIDDILSHFRDDFSEDLFSELPHIRSMVNDYLEGCLETVSWEPYTVIGFSTTFAQNLSSLALARRIKDIWSDKIVVFGGGNCEGEMGIELHRRFPFIDYICSGESDWLFPELVQRLSAGHNVEDLPGLVYRRDGETIANGTQAPPVFDLDALPLPDFDDYFIQLEQSGLALKPDDIRLMLETSRGCWWGEKSHCTFCGLNSDTLVYRSKTSQRALEEFTHLAHRYPAIHGIEVVDKILDMHYFQDVIPGLIQLNLGLNIFYFTKANLNRNQLSMLKRAGIQRIQPGIESLDSQVLRLMRKGCTATQNIQLLKWARELGLEVVWNFITGFPGEDPEAYQRMAEKIPVLSHLQPPTGPADQVRLDRFSPYFQQPEMYGMLNVRPAASYSYIYPFPDESLARLAYYFDFDYADGHQPESYTHSLGLKIKGWYCKTNSGSLLSFSTDSQLILYDTRSIASKREFVLHGISKVVYEFCDEGQTIASIVLHLQSLDESYRSQANPSTVEALLEPLLESHLMLRVDDRYLNLAVPLDDQAQAYIEDFVASIEKPTSFHK